MKRKTEKKSNWKPKIYFVSGAAGFIAFNLIKHLLSKGCFVHGFDSEVGDAHNMKLCRKLELRYPKTFKMYKKPIEFAEWEFKRYKPEAVIHLGFQPRVQYSIEYPKQTNLINVQGFLELLELMRKSKVKRLVFSSSSSVYGEPKRLPQKETDDCIPMSPYALQKLACEHYARLYHELYEMETISLRFFNVFGEHMNPNSAYANLIPKIIKLSLQNKPATVYGTGDNRRAYTHVSDIIDAIMLAANTNKQEAFGDVFNVGDKTTYSVNQVVDAIQESIGCEKKIKRLPAVVEPAYTQPDTTKAYKMFGWRPKVDFYEGLKLTIDSMNEDKR